MGLTGYNSNGAFGNAQGVNFMAPGLQPDAERRAYFGNQILADTRPGLLISDVGVNHVHAMETERGDVQLSGSFEIGNERDVELVTDMTRADFDHLGLPLDGSFND